MPKIDNLKWLPLANVREHKIPAMSGVYFIRAGNGKFLRYPEGESLIFYIGQSVNLRQRLRTHCKYHNEASSKESRVLEVYYARYEYSSRYKGEYAYVIGNDPKGMESKELESFARKHFSFPLGNSAGSWKTLNKDLSV